MHLLAKKKKFYNYNNIVKENVHKVVKNTCPVQKKKIIYKNAYFIIHLFLLNKVLKYL